LRYCNLCSGKILKLIIYKKKENNLKTEMISKKELLKMTGISYGQLYRWKRENLIPDEWFVKTSVSTGQETFFDENLILPRIKKILNLKDNYSLDKLAEIFSPDSINKTVKVKDMYSLKDTDVNLIHKFLFNEYEDLSRSAAVYMFSKLKERFSFSDDDFSIPEGNLNENLKVYVYTVYGKPFYIFVKGEILPCGNIEIKEVYNFTEVVNELKAKLSNNKGE